LICSYFLILHAYQRSNKYQSYIFFAFQPDLRSNPRSTANKASMLTITPPMRLTPIKISQGLLRDKKNYRFNCAYLSFIILWRTLAYFFTWKILFSTMTGWLRIRIICFKWSNMSTHRLLIQWARLIKIQINMLALKSYHSLYYAVKYDL
jgi:hypothetical protein